MSIVVGTSIGAGMLGLPVETARSGFFPSICLFLLTWFITIVTGLLFSDVILSRAPNSNYVSLGKTILGKKYTGVIFGFYILLFYSLIAAYTKAVGTLLAHDFSLVGSAWAGSLFFIFLFLPLMCLGTSFIGRVNGFLTILMLGSFFLLISLGVQNVSLPFLAHQNWAQSFFSLPLLISSFGFHGTLPSLVDYLDRDRRKIQWAIVVGCTITLLIYLAWEFLVLGSVPLTGEISLTSAWMNDQTAITPMSQLSQNSSLWSFAHVFSLTAIITSFCGVSIGLIDFLIDAFQWKRSFATKAALLSAIYVSVLLLSLTDLRIFYLSLNYGAGIAGIFLLIFLPAFMARKAGHQGKTIATVLVFSAVALASCLISFFV
ncbi:MAG: hypothetical protein KGJ02_08475 [Verrucomicrobiota bacterium]|nr:hypothetical protein [Verrucomicrobiota bacterium]